MSVLSEASWLARIATTLAAAGILGVIGYAVDANGRLDRLDERTNHQGERINRAFAGVLDVRVTANATAQQVARLSDKVDALNELLREQRTQGLEDSEALQQVKTDVAVIKNRLDNQPGLLPPR